LEALDPCVGVIPDWTAILVISGLIALVFSLGRLLRRCARSRSGPQQSAPDARRQPGSQTIATEPSERRLRETAEELMAEIEELGRDVRAQVETRMRTLTELIDRADAAASRLREAGPAPRPPRTPEGTGASSPGRRPDDGFEEVRRLADEGLDPGGIAARTDFEKGEVELILGLRGLGRDGVARGPGDGRGRRAPADPPATVRAGASGSTSPRARSPRSSWTARAPSWDAGPGG
jgi:hypothetical protein